ncbi:MFS transporter [Erythrobacter sp.]|uniref:AmpG family muropeptide MFS transporter n=1 Tax=Erythrobacter sp. TaxID=1042 RepID=UPI001B2B13D6|nr:MFS transporter [Erythrobacter sp.]MBO6526319.1 MFS transporter [Erythrobacter sp.]MBO6530572.1 MFS transporter [Erythrobacter sp.]
MAAVAEEKKKISAWRALGMALGNRKTGFMLLFGFASGLPFALFLGTLFAWLTEAEVDLETMGIFSLIGLAYAFQFLWSPLIDKVNIPLLRKLGRRKQWIVPMQLLLGTILVTMSLLEPRSQLGMFSLLAGIGAFASATQDIAINAWRIDVADEVATIDILSTVYQMGYRLSSLVGGALGLIIAARIGWPETYALMGAILLSVGFVGLWAPNARENAVDVASESEKQVRALRQAGELAPAIRNRALALVAVLWAGAIGVVLAFMIMSMTYAPEDRPNPTEFTVNVGPWIIVATIILPALIAGWLAAKKRRGEHLLAADETPATGGAYALDHLYRALVLPLVELVGRMGWSLVLIFAVVLTYRICDAIWGTFAYPFYLGELAYTNDDVAFASKFFGVGAIIAGLALGGLMLTAIGRMPTLLIGGVLAALTNLLYADMAIGGANMQAFSDAVGFTYLIEQVPAIGDADLAKLTITIGFENLAIGIAGAAYIAWLSSIVSKKFSAVQYALLSSLTLLVGTLGRGALGGMIEEQGYFDVFILTTWIGLAAAVLVCIEWWRESRSKAAAGIVAPEAGEAMPAE